MEAQAKAYFNITKQRVEFIKLSETEKKKMNLVQTIKTLKQPSIAEKEVIAAFGKAVKGREDQLENNLRGLTYALANRKRELRQAELKKRQTDEMFKEALAKKKAGVEKPDGFTVGEFKKIMERLPIKKFQVIRKGYGAVMPRILVITDVLFIEKRREYKDLAGKKIGQMAIRVDFDRRRQGNRFRVVNLTQRTRDYYDHPCIANSADNLGTHKICFGNIHHRIHLAFEERRFFDLLDLLIDLITSPMTDSPYISWQGFLEGAKRPQKKDVERILKAEDAEEPQGQGGDRNSEDNELQQRMELLETEHRSIQREVEERRQQREGRQEGTPRARRGLLQTSRNIPHFIPPEDLTTNDLTT